MHWYWRDLIGIFADLYKNLISPNFIYVFILKGSSLGLFHVIFLKFVPELWPLIYAESFFSSMSWEQMDRISPNFKYILILTTSSLGLVHVIFCKLLPELWPLIYTKILFPFNILRTIDRISSTLKYVFILTKSSLLQSYVPSLMSEFFPAQYL